jgi:sortase (surface protein transpeptidase)
MSIPSLGIENICIEGVGSGTKAAGQLDDPVDIWKFGWFKRSPAPGVDGQGVYTCHSGYSQYQALCDKLPSLAKNAEIIVENSTGKKFTYKVVEIKTTARESVDMDEFQSVPSGHKQGVSLMTCVGDWDAAANTLADRLTIRAAAK